jgi:hypothetical protein
VYLALTDMHRALGVSDIVRRIVEETDVSQLRDLLAIARVSRTFSEPALEELWAAPPLWDLAVLMDVRIWRRTIVRHNEADPLRGYKMKVVINHVAVRQGLYIPHIASYAVPGLQTLSSSPEHVHAIGLGRRFMCHAKRVRRLRLNSHRNKFATSFKERHRLMVDPAVLALWAASPNVFPLLREVRIDKEYLMKSPAHEALLPLFLTRCALHILSLSFGNEPVELYERTQIRLLGAWAGLHDLELLDRSRYGDRDIDDFRDEGVVRNRWTAWIGRVVRDAVNVRNLHIELPLDYADVRGVLSRMPALTTLHVSNVIHVPGAPEALPPDAFPALSTLSVIEYEANRATLCRSLLSFRASSALERCTLEIRTSLRLDDACALLAAVCRHERMAHIWVDLSRPSGSGEDPERTLEDTTLLLHALRPSDRVQSLMIDNDHGLLIDVAHIEHVLDLYPSLQTWRSSRLGATSLARFMSIIQERPGVRALPVAIACSDLPSAHAQASFGTHNYTTGLSILESVLTDEVCAVVWALFPNVSASFISRLMVLHCLSFEQTTVKSHGM